MARARRINADIASIAGFRAAGAVGGIKPSRKSDCALIVTDADAMAAACFTKNRCAAAPVQLSRHHLKATRHRAVLITSGNANCATGSQGDADAASMTELCAELLGCPARQVLVCSTGVIGVPLPMAAVERGIRAAHAGLDAPKHSVAEAILTTDTVTKTSAWRSACGVKMAGIAKGSGMIHPNMATLLGVICCDAAIGKRELQAICRQAVEQSFNRISVDNDESTNDTIIVLASGLGPVLVNAEMRSDFANTLSACMQDLAKAVVRDGEGAENLIEVTVSGCRSENEANRIASAVCDSMLVKTAIAGRDPNWGRIACAIGYSGAPIDTQDLHITLNGITIFSEGMGHDDKRRPFRKGRKRVTRKELAAGMKNGEQSIHISCQRGEASVTRWTSDLTHGYITINADYTT